MPNDPIASLLAVIPPDLAERLAVIYKPNEWYVFSASLEGQQTLAGALRGGGDVLAGPQPEWGSGRVCVKFAKGRLRAANRGGKKDWRDRPSPQDVVLMLRDIAGRAPVGSSAPSETPDVGSPAPTTPTSQASSPGLRNAPGNSELAPFALDSASSSVPLPLPTARTMIRDRWRITRVLSTDGGFGTTFEALDTLTPTLGPCVLKFPKDARALPLFQREVVKTTGLNHPNICRCLHWDTDKRHGMFLVMEHGGQSVATLCEQAPLDVNVALNIVSQAAAGIDFLHAQGVDHGDVNPGNILVDERGVVRLTDFGAAAALKTVLAADGRETRLATDVVAFHHLFSAPEVLGDGERHVTSDQYSLARVLCAMLQGYASFREKRQLRPASLSDGQRQALARALAAIPQDRFRSCAEFVEALQ